MYIMRSSKLVASHAMKWIYVLCNLQFLKGIGKGVRGHVATLQKWQTAKINISNYFNFYFILRRKCVVNGS